MKHLRILALAAVVVGAGAATPAAAQTPHAARETQADLAREARITEAAARRTALAAVRDGRVKSFELEREDGHLVYSYDIEVTGRTGIDEVQVDARTGRIVSHEHETPEQEAAEAAEDSRGA